MSWPGALAAAGPLPLALPLGPLPYCCRGGLLLGPHCWLAPDSRCWNCRVFISVDIEGVAGSAHGDEAAKTHADYAQFAERMTAEAVAACEGAIAAGATEIWVKDAHGSGRNIMQERLPKEATLVRGWSGHPFAMVQELDSSFGEPPHATPPI